MRYFSYSAEGHYLPQVRQQVPDHRLLITTEVFRVAARFTEHKISSRRRK